MKLKEIKEMECSHCHKKHFPKRKDKKYCSHSCRQLAYVLRKARNEINIIIEKPVVIIRESKKGIINRFIKWLWNR